MNDRSTTVLDTAKEVLKTLTAPKPLLQMPGAKLGAAIMIIKKAFEERKTK